MDLYLLNFLLYTALTSFLFDRRLNGPDRRFESHAPHSSRTCDCIYRWLGRRRFFLFNFFHFPFQLGKEFETLREDRRDDTVPVVRMISRLTDREDDGASPRALLRQDAPVSTSPKTEQRDIRSDCFLEKWRRIVTKPGNGESYRLWKEFVIKMTKKKSIKLYTLIS